MKKIIFVVCTVLLCISLSIIVVSAHSGRTDSSGGHYNHSTGEYHYHHGYFAHDHYDINGDGEIDCPLALLRIITISLMVFIGGFFIWQIMIYLVIAPPLTQMCKKILKADINEDKIRLASYIIITTIIIAVVSICVLVSEGIL